MHQRLDRELEIRKANSKSLSGVSAADITGITDMPVMKLFLLKTNTNIKNHEQLSADDTFKLQSSLSKDLNQHDIALAT